MNYCNWCRYKNTNGFKNNAPQCNLHAKLTNRFRISTRIPDREEKKSCSYTQLIRTDWSPSLANMFERIQTHSNAFKWVDHLRLHDEIPLSPHSQTHSNGLIVFICKHVWTHSNVFERIQTHSNRLIIFICMMKSHWAPAWAGPRLKLPSGAKSVGNRFTRPRFQSADAQKNENRAKYFSSTSKKYKH